LSFSCGGHFLVGDRIVELELPAVENHRLRTTPRRFSD
jgi:hypothetical protein